MQHILGRVASVTPLDTASMELARSRQQQLTKPAGSLGRLEDIAIQIAGITKQPLPNVKQKAVIIMAGDHGVTKERVSAYPSAVTSQMVYNFLQGGAAINALAHHVGARVIVVDVGVAADLSHLGLHSRKVALGTANMVLEPAMTHAQMLEAIQVGIDVFDTQLDRGIDLVATGDMGIGNTTASSAIAAILLQMPVIPVVLDGFISGAAALIAVKLNPVIGTYLLAGHNSVEQGHRLILERLGLLPLLDLKLRLGEGTGAVLAMSIIEAALRAHSEMATFTEAGVSTREEK